MLSLFQRLPLGGKLSAERTDEGQLLVFFHSSISLLQLPLIRFAFAQHLPPQGEGYNIAYLFPIIFCNSAINDEISLNERYTEA